METKKRTTIPQAGKIRAELQKQIESICPFCDNEDVGHFQIHHIDENRSNHEIDNLLLLCPTCHSKISKGDISSSDVYKKKILTVKNSTSKNLKSSKLVNFNDNVENAIIGDNNKISIKQTKEKNIQKYPEGCIGYDTVKANYISHLIKRYNEYKQIELGSEKLNYATFSSHLKKKYKLGPTRTINHLSIDKFEELAEYIHSRIDKTKFARMKGKNHKNYSTYEEYRIS